MIDCKYPTIASGATLRRSSMKIKAKKLRPLSVASTRNIDSKFTPIGRADSTT
jgi:hypothetical protein